MVTATAWIQRLSAALVLLTAVSSTAHAQKTDVVRLANGDRLTGEVKRLKKGQLEFSTDDAGTVFLEWDKIVSLEAARQFDVTTSDGRRFFGSLEEGAPRVLIVREGTDVVSLPTADVTVITPIGVSFWSKLDGSLDIGFSYTRSSKIAQLALNSTTVSRSTWPPSAKSGRTSLSRSICSTRTTAALPRRAPTPTTSGSSCPLDGATNVRSHRLAAWVLFLTAGVSAQDPATAPRTEVRDVAVVAGRIDRIDSFSRSLILRTAEGLSHNVYVGRELTIFHGLRAGDSVTVRVTESVVVALRPNAKTTALEDSTAAANKGARGAGADVIQQLKTTVIVESVDMATQMVTYKGADNRRVTRFVPNRALIDGLKRGDIVEITYTRERAIELTKNR